eukprot:TRINITY_DN9615_c0_g1_i2.p1 TRINITY_DN9615_c0_g1~~TRINITY_DN9615_c0_g1_i2.p1  ORF type:complete len:505 (+),score=-41.92 TRINITY_DN9615_c0_g1_i2:613-2127(+)
MDTRNNVSQSMTIPEGITTKTRRSTDGRNTGDYKNEILHCTLGSAARGSTAIVQREASPKNVGADELLQTKDKAKYEERDRKYQETQQAAVIEAKQKVEQLEKEHCVIQEESTANQELIRELREKSECEEARAVEKSEALEEKKQALYELKNPDPYSGVYGDEAEVEDSDREQTDETASYRSYASSESEENSLAGYDTDQANEIRAYRGDLASDTDEEADALEEEIEEDEESLERQEAYVEEVQENLEEAEAEQGELESEKKNILKNLEETFKNLQCLEEHVTPLSANAISFFKSQPYGYSDAFCAARLPTNGYVHNHPTGLTGHTNCLFNSKENAKGKGSAGTLTKGSAEHHKARHAEVVDEAGKLQLQSPRMAILRSGIKQIEKTLNRRAIENFPVIQPTVNHALQDLQNADERKLAAIKLQMDRDTVKAVLQALVKHSPGREIDPEIQKKLRNFSPIDTGGLEFPQMRKRASSVQRKLEEAKTIVDVGSVLSSPAPFIKIG